MGIRDIRSIDVGMLRAFSALMRERNVSRAATVLFLSQPAVSALLRKLRQVFDDPLFKRVKSGVEPTPLARQLAPRIDKALDQISALLTLDARFDLAESERVFRIFGATHASLAVLRAVTAQIVKAGSKARIVWDSPRNRPLAELLRRGVLDLALVERDTAPAGVDCVCVQEDEFVLIAGANWAGPEVPTAPEFCAYPQVVMGLGNDSLEEAIDAAVGRLGLQRSPSIAAYAYMQMIDLVANAGMLAVVPRPVIDVYKGAVRILPSPIPLPAYRLWACWARDSQDDSGVVWLKNQVLGAFRH